MSKEIIRKDYYMIENENMEELIRNRKELVNTLKKNNSNLENILSGIYTKPDHFIFEILQNAEDAKAKKVIFHLDKDKQCPHQ